jgi:hypothetical protein
MNNVELGFGRNFLLSSQLKIFLLILGARG